jgi:hypothetical protein
MRILLTTLFLIGFAFAQEENESDTNLLKRLVSRINKAEYKKPINKRQKAGTIEFSKVDVNIDGSIIKLDNKKVMEAGGSDEFFIFNSDVYLSDTNLIFDGTNRYFMFQPPNWSR